MIRKRIPGAGSRGGGDLRPVFSDSRRLISTVALVFAVAAGCGGPSSNRLSIRHAALPPVHPPPSSPAKLSEVPAWKYWEPVETPIVSPTSAAVELPVSPLQLTRSSGIDVRWAAASTALREAVSARGFALTRAIHPSTRLGDFYADLVEHGIPCVITLDVLFFLAHLALDRAFADVDAYVVAPLLATMLHHIDVRLAHDGRAVRADLAEPYLVARGIVAVALALAEPTYEAAPSLARWVADERARVVAHAGVAASPWLGVTIDYSAMTPGGMSDRNEERAGWFRAVSWLENASLALEGVGERHSHGHVDVAMARVHARAALLLTRAIEEGVDPNAASAWERIEGTSELLIGDTDDVTPRDLSVAAARAGFDLRNEGWLANVVRVDGLRHAVARGRVAPSFHLLEPRVTPDGQVLQSLTFPIVGPRSVTDPPATWVPTSLRDPPATAHDAVRALPCALDFAAWLGSAEARAALHDSGDDAYERYDETLERLAHARPPDESLAVRVRHGTPYLSMIDAIETWIGPSAGDDVLPAASTSAWRKRKAEVALAAWTELRHDATAFTRIALADAHLTAHAPETASALAFVEPHPEAIAKLAGFVRQTARVLATEGALPSGSPALRILTEVDDLLWTALGAAVYETADDSLPPLLETALSSFPARLSALEAAVADTGAAEVAVAVDVHVDVASSRALEEATGRIEELWMVMREPSTRRLWLALGASIPHHEIVHPLVQRMSDTAWRTLLHAGGEPSPGALARGYLLGAMSSPP